jgi:UDP-N-acetyl-D-galactosamine dehydrogenase
VNILKVTSGSTKEVANMVDELYGEIISAGTYKAESIKVAEAAKVIENTQRDLNIALINELAMLFQRMGIDTESVLLAAGTKWNFLPFRPGLVGGHCIGVDPYYLTHKAQAIGYHPELILAGRRVNDGMGSFVATQLIKAMAKRGIRADGSKILVLGLAFKENCPDLRNTKVVDIIHELRDYSCDVCVFDPWVSRDDSRKEYGIELLDEMLPNAYDAVILAVAHDQFRQLDGKAIRSLCKPMSIIYDLKYVLKSDESDLRL